MIKDDSPVLEPNPIETTKNDNSNRNTTSTLPMDQVMESLKNDDMDESFEKKAKRKRTIILALVITGLVLLIVAIIVIGIIIWR